MNTIRLADAFVLVLAIMVAGTSCGHGEDNKSEKLEDFSALQESMRGEYLVTLSAQADVEVITRLYGQFGIQKMQNVGNNIFLVTLSKDPGLATMERLRAQESRVKAVQANLVYPTNPKLGPGTDY